MPFKKKLGHILSYLLQIVILTIFFSEKSIWAC